MLSKRIAMRILILYGSTEGHTRDLSAFVAKVLREDGQEVIVRDSAAKEPPPDPSTYDLIFLASSLHVGRYQAALMEFARTHHETLNAMPSAFISVSLSAAGENPDDWEGLQECVGRFVRETMWTPKAIHHAAGAIRNSQYDFFKRLAIKYIARQHGKQTVTSQDYDMTDYPALKSFVFNFVNHEIGKHGRRSGALPPAL
jgi:menaquinone-dependent protoporphyrinogen oxidase